MVVGGVDVVVKGVANEGMVRVGEAMVEASEAVGTVMSKGVGVMGKADEATGSDCN